MGPLDIGLVILVTGIAQLVTAPVVVQIDRYVDARLLSAIGFGAFAIGLLMSGFQTIATGYDEMFWPQVVRGAFVALCILPPIRFALGFISREHIAVASGLFNLSRNLGGAIGIALIDTIVFSRGPEHADRIVDLIKADPTQAAAALSLTVDDLPDPQDPGSSGIMDHRTGQHYLCHQRSVARHGCHYGCSPGGSAGHGAIECPLCRFRRGPP
jgi:DHA2 family multidrug resistance protein